MIQNRRVKKTLQCPSDERFRKTAWEKIGDTGSGIKQRCSFESRFFHCRAFA
jgi:hypothetical protein